MISNMHFECWRITFTNKNGFAMDIGILLRVFWVLILQLRTQSGSKFGEGCHFLQFLLFDSAICITAV